MKKYLSLFRIRLLNGLQYRAVLLSGMAARFVWAFMEILAYEALYRSGHADFSMSFSQMVSYIWVQQALYAFFLVVFSDGEIYSTISSGSIAYELVHPIDLYGRWFAQAAANRISGTVMNCLPVLLIALMMPEPYRMSLPLTPVQFFLFLFSVILGLFVTVAFAMLMYISLFYLLSQRGIKIIITALTGFLSGGVIPLPFFPEPILAVVRLLPFAAMQNMPLQIYTGNLVGTDALLGIAFQLFWLAVLFGIGKLAMGCSFKNVVVQGG